MGGLVGRYFISALGGGKAVYKLILLGTPVFGAVDALKAFRFGEYPATLLGELFGLRLFSEDSTRPIDLSMSSLFQLLPTYNASVTGAITLKDLGLDLRVPLDELNFKNTEANEIFQTYKHYGF